MSVNRYQVDKKLFYAKKNRNYKRYSSKIHNCVIRNNFSMLLTSLHSYRLYSMTIIWRAATENLPTVYQLRRKRWYLSTRNSSRFVWRYICTMHLNEEDFSYILIYTYMTSSHFNNRYNCISLILVILIYLRYRYRRKIKYTRRRMADRMMHLTLLSCTHTYTKL